jgi:chemotaxis protein CheX
MTTEFSLETLTGAIGQIAASVFDTMMNLELTACAEPWFPSGDRLTSAIHLAGDWEGAVMVECDRGQACRFAGRFLSMEPPAAVDDDVRDVLGELANMIGGNLKCVLTSGIRLSMPSVIDGSDYSVRVCGSAVAERLSFHCEEGNIWITILTKRL